MEMNNLETYVLEGAVCLTRLDINSPIDHETKRIKNFNRIDKSIPTLQYLIEQKAKVVILAHQGDTLDYQNLIPLKEHANKLSELLGKEVVYIDDVCGAAACEAVTQLKPGELVLLGNLRYLTEEVSSFENVVKLNPEDMKSTWLIRALAPLADYYVNDAFSAAHRSCPSMVGFQEVLPSMAGVLFQSEFEALSKVVTEAAHPSTFVLGGAKISDAFGMMEQVLRNGTADYILTQGVTGVIMIIASGVQIGEKYLQWLDDRGMMSFVEPAKTLLNQYSDKIISPIDFAFEKDGNRVEVDTSQMDLSEAMFLDIGTKTIEKFKEVINKSATVFANGPAGVYENVLFEKGTQEIMESIANSDGYTVLGGGDTVTAAEKYVDLDRISYVCTAGGAMVRFMSGKTLPLVEAMDKDSKTI